MGEIKLVNGDYGHRIKFTAVSNVTGSAFDVSSTDEIIFKMRCVTSDNVDFSGTCSYINSNSGTDGLFAYNIESGDIVNLPLGDYVYEVTAYTSGVSFLTNVFNNRIELIDSIG